MSSPSLPWAALLVPQLLGFAREPERTKRRERNKLLLRGSVCRRGSEQAWRQTATQERWRGQGGTGIGCQGTGTAAGGNDTALEGSAAGTFHGAPARPASSVAGTCHGTAARSASSAAGTCHDRSNTHLYLSSSRLSVPTRPKPSRRRRRRGGLLARCSGWGGSPERRRAAGG